MSEENNKLDIKLCSDWGEKAKEDFFTINKRYRKVVDDMGDHWFYLAINHERCTRSRKWYEHCLYYIGKPLRHYLICLSDVVSKVAEFLNNKEWEEYEKSMGHEGYHVVQARRKR